MSKVEFSEKYDRFIFSGHILPRNKQKRKVEATYSLPIKGINSETGILVMLHDQSEDMQHPHYQPVLKTLSNRYNMAVMLVNYLGTNVKLKSKTYIPETSIQALKQYCIEKIAGFNAENFNISQIINYMTQLTGDLSESFCMKEADAELTNEQKESMNDYFDYGEMQALDVIQAYKILVDKFNLNVGRSVIAGFAYGGFLAGMVQKFAPHTFKLVVGLNAPLKMTQLDCLAKISKVNLNNTQGTFNYNHYFGSVFTEIPEDKWQFTLDDSELRDITNVNAPKGFKGILVYSTESFKQKHELLLANVESTFIRDIYLLTKEDEDGDCITDAANFGVNIKSLLCRICDKYCLPESLFFKAMARMDDYKLKSKIIITTTHRYYTLDYSKTQLSYRWDKKNKGIS